MGALTSPIYTCLNKPKASSIILFTIVVTLNFSLVHSFFSTLILSSISNLARQHYIIRVFGWMLEALDARQFENI